MPHCVLEKISERKQNKMSLDPESEAYYQAIKDIKVLEGLVELTSNVEQLKVTMKKLNEIVGLI